RVEEQHHGSVGEQFREPAFGARLVGQGEVPDGVAHRDPPAHAAPSAARRRGDSGEAVPGRGGSAPAAGRPERGRGERGDRGTVPPPKTWPATLPDGK